jgi:pilus assembly protein CpaE
LDETDLAILVATMDVPTIKNINLCIHTLKSLQYPDEMVALAINRADKNIGIKKDEIESALRKKALISIPNDIKVTLSTNKGVPIVLDAPKSPAAIRLTQLADKLEEMLKINEKISVDA